MYLNLYLAIRRTNNDGCHCDDNCEEVVYKSLDRHFASILEFSGHGTFHILGNFL